MTATASDTDDLIASLADPRGAAGLIGQLAKGQLGKRMLQLKSAASSPGTPLQRDGYALLATVQRVAPDVFRTVLLDPDTAILLRDSGGDPGAVARIAAAAAILARVPATVTVPVTGGRLLLPGAGTVELTGDAGPAMTTVRVAADSVTVTTDDTLVRLPGDLACKTSSWRPPRTLSVGEKARLTIRFAADGPLSDAFSSLYPDTALARPAADDEAGWQQALGDAWRILEDEHPGHAAAIAAGLRTIVPLSPGEGLGSRSVTLAGVFGALAMSLPSRPEFFAVTLVHEFQHAKLDAALDLIRLYRPDDMADYYTPWRPDPRPLGALLQGVYAHLGVVQYWDVRRRQAVGDQMLRSHVEFVRWRDDTWRAAQELLTAPELTAAGRSFAGRLLGELDRMRTEPAPGRAHRLARLLALDQSVSWRLRNLEVDQEAARRLAESWLGGGEAQDLLAGCVRRRAAQRAVPDERTRLLHGQLSGKPAEAMDGISAADRHYLRGDYATALRAYEARVADDPADLDAWGGLALTAAACDDPAHLTLTAAPELVAEVYRQAAALGYGSARPRQLALWLGAGT